MAEAELSYDLGDWAISLMSLFDEPNGSSFNLFRRFAVNAFVPLMFTLGTRLT